MYNQGYHHFLLSGVRPFLLSFPSSSFLRRPHFHDQSSTFSTQAFPSITLSWGTGKGRGEGILRGDREKEEHGEKSEKRGIKFGKGERKHGPSKEGWGSKPVLVLLLFFWNMVGEKDFLPLSRPPIFHRLFSFFPFWGPYFIFQTSLVLFPVSCEDQAG